MAETLWEYNMAVKIQFRRDTAANWSSSNPILAVGELGLETDTNQFKIGNGVDSWSLLSYGGLQGPAQTDVLQDFGNGEDGDVVISAGITTLTQDMFYNSLTITGSGKLVTNGYRVFVKENLDLSNAGVDCISATGNAGNSATNQTGATGGAAYTAATLGANTAGGSGATGVTGAGAQAAASTGTSPSNGGSSGAGGAGGAGVSAGGTLRAGAAASVHLDFARFTYDLVRGVTLIQAGAGGPGGSSGGGDGTNLGRGGGGGGAGGGILFIAARNIIKSALTPASAICACGGRGGNGASGAAGNVGGGGGGGGAGGGYIYLAYETLTGPVITNLLNASGGDGGNGGNGIGTGVGGSGGTGGVGGRIRRHRTTDQVGSTVIGSAGLAGSAGVGNLGGNGGAGGVSFASL